MATIQPIHILYWDAVASGDIKPVGTEHPVSGRIVYTDEELAGLTRYVNGLPDMTCDILFTRNAQGGVRIVATPRLNPDEKALVSAMREEALREHAKHEQALQNKGSATNNA